MENLEISKILTLSSAHISERTSRILNMPVTCRNLHISVYNKADYGWFVHIPAYDLKDFENLPTDLYNCMKFAQANECDWLCLDCDGETVDTLKTYEW